MKINKIKNAILVTGFLMVGSASANIVSNDSFQTGDMTGWTASGWFVTTGIAGVTAAPGDTYFASTGCVNEYCTLSQTLTTVAGGTYDFTFSFNPGADVSSGNADTQVYWNGSEVDDIGIGDLGWTTVSLDGLVATGTSTTIEFSGYQNPAWNGIDDVNVSLTGTSAVPEPAGIALLAIGLLGITALRRRAK